MPLKILTMPLSSPIGFQLEASDKSISSKPNDEDEKTTKMMKKKIIKMRNLMVQKLKEKGL